MSALVAWVSRGDFFRRFVSIFLQFVAVFTALIGLLWVIIVAVNGFRFAVGPGEILAVLLMLVVMILAVYMSAHLSFIRSWTVAELSDSQYSATPVASVLIKLFGEQLAILFVLSGVAGLIVMLFAGGYAPWAADLLGYGFNPAASMLVGGGAFLGGLAALLAGVFGAFTALILAYLLAEAVVVFVNIAHDVRLLRETNG